MHLFAIHVFLLIHLASAATKLCYAPDGSLSPGDGYMPCINTINVDSMCCVLNVTALELIGKTAADADSCAVNGLCQISTGEFARDFCTDQTWKSPNCLNICTQESSRSGGVSDSFSIMTHCADGSWCCGQGNDTSCCNQALGFQLASEIPPYAMGKSATVVSTVTATLTATTTATVTGVSMSSSGNGTNNVAIGLGVTLGAVVLGATALLFIMFRRLRLREAGNVSGNESVMHGGGFGKTRFGEASNELEQPYVIHEIPERKEPVEMDGGPVVPKKPARRSKRY